MFVLGGAFDGVEPIIASRINKNTMGFVSDDNSKAIDDKKLLEKINRRIY